MSGGHAAEAEHGHRRIAMSRRASVQEVAVATLRCLRRHVPAAVPGIVFLSGGQEEGWQPAIWTPSTGCR